jgi:hypothetical protein
MFCKACGKRILDDFVFCQGCGSLQRAGLAARPRWEIAEIQYFLVATPDAAGKPADTWQFVAEILAPPGKRHGYASREHPASRPLQAQCLDEVIDIMFRDGWEALAHGNEWYSYRFRRPLN